jgi:hypothetical protein
MAHVRSKKPKRTKGWIGWQVTVCGQPLHPPPPPNIPLICLLPPGHQPDHIHSSLALNLETDRPIVLTEDTQEGTIQWLDV